MLLSKVGRDGKGISVSHPSSQVTPTRNLSKQPIKNLTQVFEELEQEFPLLALRRGMVFSFSPLFRESSWQFLSCILSSYENFVFFILVCLASLPTMLVRRDVP